MVPYDIPDQYGVALTKEVAEAIANDLRSDAVEVTVTTYAQIKPPYWAELGYESEEEYIDAIYDDATE